MASTTRSTTIAMVTLLGGISYLSGCAKSKFGAKDSSGKKPSTESATVRTGDTVPEPEQGGDGGFVETAEGNTVVVDDPGKTDTPKGKLSCSLYMHRNGNHGCGPNGYHVWWVWIGSTVPTLTNGVLPTAPELIAQATTKGVYGYAPAYLNKPQYNHLYCDKKVAEETPMPLTYTHEGYEYKLWTDGIPGSEDCQAYTGTISPLIIALNSLEIQLLSPSKGPLFDLDATGEAVRYAWPKDGNNHMFLALDKNKDGKINSGEELFGNATVGPDKKTSDNGFLALQKYDSNKDGSITEEDAVYSTLLLWGDVNSNGVAEKDELFSLKDKNIKKINLNYKVETKKLDFFGSERKEISTVEFTNGKKAPIVDAWFVAGPSK